jgi:uncharacterized membrane protein
MWWMLIAEANYSGWQGVARATAWLALIFLLVASAFAIVKRVQRGGILTRFRDYNADDGDDPSALLSKFREMHARGTLSDTEYRTIKTKLAAQIQSQALASRSPSDS